MVYKELRAISQLPLTDLTLTLTMKKFHILLDAKV